MRVLQRRVLGAGRRRGVLLVVLLLSVALAPASATAAPTAKQKKEATALFHTCHDMERHGPAIACWKLWLERYRDVGHEAEVIFAEERVASKTAIADSPYEDCRARQPAKKRSSERATDESGKNTSADGPRRARRPEPDASGRAVVDGVVVDLSEEDVEDVELEEEDAKATDEEDSADDEKKAKAKDARATKKPAFVTGSVLDFCELTPRQDAKRFVKQRVVVLSPVGAEAIDGDSKIGSAGGSDHLRDVFLARFPLDRFHNVVSHMAGEPGWARRKTLSLETLQDRARTFDAAQPGAPSSTPDEAEDDETTDRLDENPYATDTESDDSDSSSEAPREGAFVAYSLSCVDYVVVPEITSYEAEWKDVEVKTKQGKRKVKALTLHLEADVGIFKRVGTNLKLVETLDASVPSMLDMASDLAGETTAAMEGSLQVPGLDVTSKIAKTVKLPGHISAFPDAACALESTGVEGTPGLGECEDDGISPEAWASSLAEVDERFGEACKAAREPSGNPDEARVICEVRVRGFQLVRSLQKSAREVDGWKLFAPLQIGTRDDPKTPALSLGKEEGVKIGYGFYAVDAKGAHRAFFKVTDVGPGGEPGIQDPSALNRRFGSAPEGARLEEYPQLGLGLTPYFSVASLTYGHGRTVETTPTGFSVYRLPSAVFGVGLDFSYDSSPAIGWTETHLRVGVGYLVGRNGANAEVGLIPIDLVFEKGFYAGPRLTYYLGIGGTMTHATVDLAETDEGLPKEELTAFVGGALGRTGFDIMISPTVSMRFELFSRINGKASYDAGDDTVPDGFQRREDHFATVGSSFALGVTL